MQGKPFRANIQEVIYFRIFNTKFWKKRLIKLIILIRCIYSTFFVILEKNSAWLSYHIWIEYFMANSKTSVTYLGQVLWIQEHTICLSTQIYLSYFYIHYNIAPPTYFVLYMLQLSSRVSNNWSCFFPKIYNNDLNFKLIM